MAINMIVAVDESNAIGYKGKLLFRIKPDLERFQDLTTNSSGHRNICVMGRRTFEELKKPLSHRTNVVISRNESLDVPKEVIVENDIHKILNHYLESGIQDRDIWVLGGISIFEEFVPHTDKIYLTKIHTKAEKSDTYFKEEWLSDFHVTDVVVNYSDQYECAYSFITYERNKME